jgi:DNA-binding response OmpR family regulator
MKRILVVDDDYELVENLTAFLQCEGYDVISADNGKLGLTRLKIDKPDLLLTDFMMPVAGGGDLVRGMHDTLTQNSVPVIMMSAVAGGVPQLDPSLHVAAFLKKPFRCEDLLEKVVRLIGVGEHTSDGSHDEQRVSHA